MKKFTLPMMVAALMVSGWQTASALPVVVSAQQDGTYLDAASGKKDKKAGTVPAALKEIEFFNGKPSTKAKYYVYLQSASWCGPCNREMPDMVKQHEIMKKDGRVELILVGCDSTREKAEGFLKQYNAEFAGVLASGDGAKLPGLVKANGIPHATIVDAKGKVLYDGHASEIASGNWKKHTIEKSKDKAKKGKKK